MSYNYPHYKLVVSYFGTSGNEKLEEEKILLFKEDSPIKARQQAIERYNSYLDIFEDGEYAGNIHNWKVVLENDYDDYTIPTLNLYVCYNDDAENDLVLFGSLLENFDERMEELEDEYKFYESNNINHDGSEILVGIDGNRYKILKNSLIKEEDKLLIK